MSRSFRDRVAEVIEQEVGHPEMWHYLSFADETFLGGAIVKARGVAGAVMLCHSMGINPGGEVACFSLPDEILPPEQYRNRLLTKSDILEFWPDSKSIREHEEGAKP